MRPRRTASIIKALAGTLVFAGLANAYGTPASLKVVVHDADGRPIEGVPVRIVKTNDKSLVGDYFTSNLGEIGKTITGASKKIDIIVGGRQDTYVPAEHSCPGGPEQFGWNYDPEYLCGYKKRDYHKKGLTVTLSPHTATSTVCRLTGDAQNPHQQSGGPPYHTTLFPYGGQDTARTVGLVRQPNPNEPADRSVLWWFGDTWSWGTKDWRFPNVIAETSANTDANPAQCETLGFEYTNYGQPGLPRDCSSPQRERTVWLLNSFVAPGDPARDANDANFYIDSGDLLHVVYNSRAGDCQHDNDVGTNPSREIGIATYDNYEPQLDRLTRESGPTWDPTDLIELARSPRGASVLHNGSYYIFNVPTNPNPWAAYFGAGTHCVANPGTICSNDWHCFADDVCGRAVVTTRISRDNVLDKNAYEYWDVDQNAFFSNQNPEPVLVTPIGNLSNSVSVGWSEFLGRWIMIGGNFGSPRINSKTMLWTAPELTGPWTGPTVIAENINAVQSYNPHLVAGYTGGDGERLIYWAATYQAKGSEITPQHPTYASGINYNVFLYQTDLSRVSLLCGDGETNGSCTAGDIGEPCSENAHCDTESALGVCFREDCDDGNSNSRDGCSSVCKNE